ncbi:response regulator [Dyadobacter psychrotolerans]|nr:response regulator [Dyadobacter psychrotolerans]
MNTIYIVDDSADQRFLLSFLLKRINPKYELVVFDGARALLDMLSRVKENGADYPQVIFLDYQMPEMDGYEALTILKSKDQGSAGYVEVPVVIYSSSSDRDLIQKCLESGAFAFLQKPVNLDELKNLLRSM